MLQIGILESPSRIWLREGSPVLQIVDLIVGVLPPFEDPDLLVQTAVVEGPSLFGETRQRRRRLNWCHWQEPSGGAFHAASQMLLTPVSVRRRRGKHWANYYPGADWCIREVGRLGFVAKKPFPKGTPMRTLLSIHLCS